MKPILTADNLSKWFDEVIALNSLSVSVGRGITGLLGPNGSGKSTLFKIAMGMVKPGRGEIRLLGQNPWSNPALLQHVGYCPDHEYLPPDATCREYLKLVGGLRGLSGWSLDDRINEAAHTLEIIKSLDRKIGDFSKGMKQRIKVASALLHDPPLLILDEPLTGTDPKLRKRLIEILLMLNKVEGKDIIVSSHVLPDIEKLTDRVVLLYKGRNIASGKVSEIRELLDQYPHNIVIESPSVRKIAEELMEYDWLYSLEFNEGPERILVKVSDPKSFYDIFPEIVLDNGYKINEMYSRDEDLDSVFRYLMEGRI